MRPAVLPLLVFALFACRPSTEPEAVWEDPLVAPAGEPEALDAAALAAIRRVHSEPGDLPLMRFERDGRKHALPLKHTAVDAVLTGPVARVRVTQTWRNPTDAALEAVYVFPLPENSAVDDLTLKIGERTIRAEIRKREEARATYEAARAAGHTAALLEQERPNVFTQSVANIPPRAELEVSVEYVQDLTYDAGEYEFVFPMVVGPRYIPGDPTGRSGTGRSPDTETVPDASQITPPVVGAGRRSGHSISLRARIESGFALHDLDVPTHEVQVSESDDVTTVTLSPRDTLPNRDFVMRYRVDAEAPQAALLHHTDARGGFFTLVVQPPKLDVDGLVGQREMIFVVDVSGSMMGRPLSMCKAAMEDALRRLRPVDTFNVYTFAGQTGQVFPRPYPASDENLKRAMAYVAGQRAGGGTELANAVDAALRPDVEPGRTRHVFFLTDGFVGNEDEILSLTRAFVEAQKGKGQRSRVFGFGVGSSVNRMLLDGLGQAGEGLAFYAVNREDPARGVEQMFHKVDSAVLEEVSVDWGGLAVSEVFPALPATVFASRPLVLHGRFTGAASGAIAVRGRVGDRIVELRVPLEASAPPGDVSLTSLWARAKIGDLSRALWDGPDETVVESITKTGLDFRLVTAYTSFVAVDSEVRVGDGKPATVVQPVEMPEDVSRKGVFASARSAMLMKSISVDLSAEGSDAVVSHDQAAAAGGGPTSPGPVVLPGTPTVAGALDRGLVSRVLAKYRVHAQMCYRAELARQSDLSGKLVLAFTIDRRGNVAGARLASSTVRNAKFEACLLNALRGWVFPAPRGGGNVVVRLPLVFQPAE